MPNRTNFIQFSEGLVQSILLLLLSGTITPTSADTISGYILDPQGNPVPNASLRLFNRANSQPREITSDAQGRYTFRELPSGEYLLEATSASGSLSGVASATVTNDLILDLTLAISSITAEVTVTASSSPLVFREVAKAIDVIDATEIADRNEFSVAETLRVVPGLRVQTVSGPGSFTTIRTRGMRSHDTAVLIDGMRFRDAGSPQGDATGFLQSMTTVDTEQIEVMRGSGSSLYGSNAMAGVVNITSKTGGGSLQGDLLVEGGGLGLFRSVPSIRGGLANDRLVYSGALSYINVTKGVRGDNPYRSVSPQGMVRFRISPTVSATGRFWYNNDQTQNQSSPAFPSAVVANFPSTGVVSAIALPTDELERFEQGLSFNAGSATFVPSPNDADNLRESSFFNGSAILRHVVSPGTSYRVHYQAVNTNRAYTDGPLGTGYQPFLENSSHFDGRTDAVHARMNSTIGTKNFLSFGYEFEKEQYFRSASGDAATATIDTFSHAVFAQDQIELLNSRLQLTVGGRFQTFQLPTPHFVGGNHPYGGELSSSIPTALTGDLALAYILTSAKTKFRAHVGNSYRSPSPFERFGGSFSSWSNSFDFWGDPRLEPERSVSVDGGIDQWFYNARLQFSATGFHTVLYETIIFDFANFPTATDPFFRFGGYRNSGGGHARGIELSTQISPGLSTDLRMAYTYTDSESDTPTIGSDYFGVPGLSDHLFTLSARQRFASRVHVTFDLFAASDYFLSPYGSNGRRMVFGGPVKGDLVVRYDLLSRTAVRLDLYTKIENMFNQLSFENGFLGPGLWAIGGLRIRY